MLESLANKYGTPLYLVDLNRAEESYRKIESAFPEGTNIAYAIKSNYTPSLVRTFNDLGSYFDIFSQGELELLLRNDCDPRKGVFTSVAETEEEYEFALEKGVRTFVLGSISGIANFDEAMRRTGVDDPEIMIRIQPLKEVNAAISTSGVDSKFGVVFTDEKDSVENAIRELDDRCLKLSGFHFHLGTQVEEPDYYIRAINKSLEFAQDEGLDIEMMDLGGGYPAKYSSEVTSIEEFGERISETVEEWRGKLGDFRLIMEPGRFLVADVVDMVVRVVNVKEMYGRTVIIVDGSEDMVELGEHDLSKCVWSITDSTASSEALIAGNLCHSEDWLVPEPIELSKVDVGDLMIFEKMGAYAINENIPFNLRKTPKVLSIKDGEVSEEDHPFDIIRKVQSAFR